jgi:hypothetical protein
VEIMNGTVTGFGTTTADSRHGEIVGFEGEKSVNSKTDQATVSFKENLSKVLVDDPR